MRKICRGRVLFPQKSVKAFLRSLFLSNAAKKSTIQEFEQKFSEYIGTACACTCSCGKIALYLSLKALNANESDEIIVPAFTVSEVVDIILLLGLKPVFADVDPDTANMDPVSCGKLVTENTRFILLTHLYGNPADVQEILKIAKDHDLKVIEDAAQACGAEYKGAKTGTFGDITYFSFGFLKNLNTLGGAIIVSDNREIIEKIVSIQKNESFAQVSVLVLMLRFFRVLLLSFLTHPTVFSVCVYPVLKWSKRQENNEVSMNLKTKPVDTKELKKLKVYFSHHQAAVGLIAMNDMDSVNEQRIKNAKLFNAKLTGLKQIRLIKTDKHNKNIYLNYVVKVKDHEQLVEDMFKRGIDLSSGFLVCCANQQSYQKFHRHCPQALVWEEENIYLPVYAPLQAKEINYMAKSIKEHYAK